MFKRSPTVNWWPTATGTRRHAVRGSRALCGLIPPAGWAERRAPFIEPACARCAVGRRMVPVTSTNVAAIGHNARTLVLNVAFHNGGRYRYFAVPRAVFEALLVAESVGSALAQIVKDGGYRFVKLADKAA